MIKCGTEQSQRIEAGSAVEIGDGQPLDQAKLHHNQFVHQRCARKEIAPLG